MVVDAPVMIPEVDPVGPNFETFWSDVGSDEAGKFSRDPSPESAWK